MCVGNKPLCPKDGLIFKYYSNQWIENAHTREGKIMGCFGTRDRCSAMKEWRVCLEKQFKRVVVRVLHCT